MALRSRCAKLVSTREIRGLQHAQSTVKRNTARLFTQYARAKAFPGGRVSHLSLPRANQRATRHGLGTSTAPTPLSRPLQRTTAARWSCSALSWYSRRVPTKTNGGACLENPPSPPYPKGNDEESSLFYIPISTPDWLLRVARILSGFFFFLPADPYCVL